MPWNKVSTTIYNNLKNKQTAVNATVIVVVIAFLEVVTDDGFACPCVTVQAARNSCSFTNGNQTLCVTSQNLSYSCLYITSLGGVSFIISILGSKLWMCVTGCCQDQICDCQPSCRCCYKELIVSMLAPVTWLIAVAIDGHPWACATTPLPYQLTDESICSKISKLDESEDYVKIVVLSKTIGWSVAIGLCIVGLVVYAIDRCCCKKSFFQDKYAVFYDDQQMELVEKYLKTQVQNRAKAAVNKRIENITLTNDDKDWKEIGNCIARGEALDQNTEQPLGGSSQKILSAQLPDAGQEASSSRRYQPPPGSRKKMRAHTNISQL